MILYHGSDVIVEKPKILGKQRKVDFGKGFYVTSDYNQAKRWALLKAGRPGSSGQSFVSIYEFDETTASQILKIKKFDCADAEWLHFVVDNRNERMVNDGADIHIGPVADDDIYATIKLFETHTIDADSAIQRFKTKKLTDQYVFHTEDALAFLKFKKADDVTIKE